MKELGKKSLNGNIADCEYCDIKNTFKTCSGKCDKEEPKNLGQITEKGVIDTIGNCANCGVEFHIHKDVTETKQETPNELESVLAKISHINDLGLSQWYEVVYYDNKWCSYSGSKTFEDGEKVVEWKYCKNLI